MPCLPLGLSRHADKVNPSGREPALDLRWSLLSATFAKVPIDGSACESVQHDSTQELWIGPLNLFSLLGYIGRKLNSDLDRASLPHAHKSPENRWLENSQNKDVMVAILSANFKL